MAKNKIQELTELVAGIKEARECSRNLGRLYEYMFDNENGDLQIDFTDAAGLSHCAIDWGDVVMCEKCRSMVYRQEGKEHSIRFIFDYFYDNQHLWVFPERMAEQDIQSIIDWIYKTINY